MMDTIVAIISTIVIFGCSIYMGGREQFGWMVIYFVAGIVMLWIIFLAPALQHV